jgi:hypothetical protein
MGLHIFIFMFSTVIDICKSVIDLIYKDKEIKLETRLRVSSILNEISNILQDTADKLKKDEYPHSNCVTMRSLSNNLHFILIDIVNMDVLDNLHSLLVESSEIERHFTTRKEIDTISKIEEASGEFKAMSIILNF